MTVSEKINAFIEAEGKGNVRDALNVALTRIELLQIEKAGLIEMLDTSEPIGSVADKIISGISTPPDQHTPEPWEITNGTDIFTELNATNASGQTADHNDGWQVANCSVGKTLVGGELVDMPYKEQSANARRIVAAVNACAGISTEMLEALPSGKIARPKKERDEAIVDKMAVMMEMDRLRAENERLRDALGKIARHRHRDKSCSLEAQGYTQVECAEIGAKDWLAGIAFDALSETTQPKPAPVQPEPINARLFEALRNIVNSYDATTALIQKSEEYKDPENFVVARAAIAEAENQPVA